MIEAATENAANGDDYTHTYTYSPTGNIIRNSAVGEYSYGGRHPQAVTGAGDTRYAYDEKGNLTGDGTWQHAYDYKNRLINSTNGDKTLNYEYDHGSERVKKTDGESATIYISEEYEIEDGVPVIYVFANGTRVAKIREGIITWYHPDHLTGANASTDAGGQLTELADYYPYGEDRISESRNQPTTHRFTDQEKDFATGLYYYGARYYNPVIGRFISLDPWKGDLLDPQSLNKYSYARNNPLKYIDPSGEFPTMSETNAFMQGMTDTVFLSGDIVTFGQFSNAFTRVEQAADRMATEGINLKTLANTAYQIAYGAAANIVTALGVGVSAGELWITANPYVLQKNAKQTEVHASTPVGRRGNPLQIQKGTNEPAKIDSINYSGHALDQMQSRGVMPSAVKNTIKSGTKSDGNTHGSTAHSLDNLKVITDKTNKVLTVITK